MTPAADPAPPVSVIVVSRGRPGHLRDCLTALSYQDHPAFEVVLVADPAGLRQRADLPVKRVAFDIANISQARNAGLAQAAGEIVAFIDDDSLAEPTWLSRLTAPLTTPGVMAATGWTRDRDGFRWQARSQRIGAEGLPREISHDGTETRLLGTEDGWAVSTLGTNCAFRADALRAIGGFDPAFAYHLDESDVNMRMSAAMPGALTAVVPLAQIIHARAGSAQRDNAAVPLTLTMQGRSSALYARRHGDEIPEEAICARLRRHLIRQMLDGRLDPLRLSPLMASLQAGLREGQQQPLPLPPPPRKDSPPAFRPMPPAPLPGPVLAGWHWHARDLRARALRQIADGRIPTLILFSPSFLPHRLRLNSGGWFEQTGGLYGASEPKDPPAKMWQLCYRICRETDLTEIRRNPKGCANVPRKACPTMGIADKRDF